MNNHVPLGYKQTEVGVIPEEWATAPFGTLASIDRGKFSARPRNDPRFYGGDIPFIQTGDVTRSGGTITTFTQTLNSDGLRVSRLFPKGTLFFTIAANIGDVGIATFEAACPDSLVAVSPISSIDKHWLLYELARRKADFESLASPGAQLNINLEKLRPYLLPVPTSPEQSAIAEALSDVDGLLGGLDRLIAKKRDLKQAAMQQLLTGQTRLPGFHGEWEVKMLTDVTQFRGGKAHEQYIADYGRFICVNSKFISTEGKVRKYATANFCCARENDVLMVMSDLPNGKALAKTFIADQDDLYAVNQRVCALTPFDNYCAEFLAYILNRNPYFLKFDDGVSQTHLLNPVFQKCPLFLPPSKAEQTAIAQVLTDMDAELAKLTQRRDKTRALKQAMMQELLTGRTRLIPKSTTEVKS